MLGIYWGTALRSVGFKWRCQVEIYKEALLWIEKLSTDLQFALQNVRYKLGHFVQICRLQLGVYIDSLLRIQRLSSGYASIVEYI